MTSKPEKWYRKTSKPWQSFSHCFVSAILLLAQTATVAQAAGVASDALTTAQRFEHERAFQKAIIEYDRVLVTEKTDITALRGKARCLVGLGQPEQALKIYDLLMTRVNDKNGTLASERAVALFSVHETDKAVAVWNEALKKPIHHPLPLKWRGIALMQQGKFKQALVDFDELVTCCPNSLMARSCRSLARATVGDWLGSTDDLNRYMYIKRSISLHGQKSGLIADVEDKSHPGPMAPPEMQLSTDRSAALREEIAAKLGRNSIASLHAQAVLSFHEHDYRRALKELSKIKTRGIDQATALALKSLCKQAVSDFDGAVSSARQAITMAQNEVAFYDLLGTIYLSANRRDEGLKALKEYAATEPKNIAPLLSIAAIQSQFGDNAGTRDTLKHLLAFKPDCVDALIMRADTYIADSKNELAADDFAKAKLLAPTNGQAMEGLGLACYQLGQIDIAVENFRAVTKIGYDLRRAYLMMALCFDKQRQPGKANMLRSLYSDFVL
jgi:tetratricopeptide (TPR) repeat protein